MQSITLGQRPSPTEQQISGVQEGDGIVSWVFSGRSESDSSEGISRKEGLTMKETKKRLYPVLSAIVLCFLLFPGNSLGAVQSSLIDFRQVLVGSQATSGLIVSNQGTTNYTVYLTMDQAVGPFSTDYSAPINLPAGESREIQITYSPVIPGTDSAIITVSYAAGWSTVGTDTVQLQGEGVEEVAPQTLIINGQDTGIIDQLYGDQPISAWIEECRVNATNRGKFAKCVFLLTNKLKRDGLISAKEKRIIRKQVILGLMKDKKDEENPWKKRKKWKKEKKRHVDYKKMKRWIAKRDD
ncbi:MAG: hypothetical protein JRH00_17005 [Deltaproteobacteria bacterium]|nr:hypothetical protein [Deltaproteobacteria bacterium]